MRKIILNLAVTLDGYIEGPNGEIDWCQVDDGSEMGEGSGFDKFLSGIDTIFYGRVSYDLWGQYQTDHNAPPPLKKLWENVHSKKKYVFSRNPKPDGKAVFINSGIEKEIKEIKSQQGKNIWLYGGAGIITSFMNAGLVDSYLLAIHPVILGGGKPLFSDIKNRIGLKLKEITSSGSGVVLLDYDSLGLSG
jgi:dihydrofolate reductase